MFIDFWTVVDVLLMPVKLFMHCEMYIGFSIQTCVKQPTEVCDWLVPISAQPITRILWLPPCIEHAVQNKFDLLSSVVNNNVDDSWEASRRQLMKLSAPWRTFIRVDYLQTPIISLSLLHESIMSTWNGRDYKVFSRPGLKWTAILICPA